MLTHLLRSKGLMSLLRRVFTIVAHTGITPRRMRRALVSFTDLLAKHNAQATFPVTAVALGRHPDVFRQLLVRAPTGETTASSETMHPGVHSRVELAIHGHRHVDLSLASEPEQAAAIEQAIALFRAHGIPFVGFRAPYLRWNDSLLAALGAARLWYDSSQSVLWPVLDGTLGQPHSHTGLPARGEKSIQLLCDFCQPQHASDHPALPFWVGDLLEIPVSLPDDEMLVERMRIRDQAQMAGIWLSTLEQCHARGELFVLQLHPERFRLCSRAVDSVLERARALRPRVWLTNLQGVTAWWRQKRALHLDLVASAPGVWDVSAHGPEDAALLLRGAQSPEHAQPWRGIYQRATQRHFALRSDVRPGIGLSPAAPLELVRFLTDQGYAVEVTPRSDGHAVYIDRSSFERRDMLPLLRKVEAAPAPMVRWAQWPEGAASALAITGDVDALTMRDYLSRPFEH